MERRKTVKGIFRNNTGKPVVGVIVTIKESSHELNDMISVSNEKGEFYVSDIVIPGIYTLQIEHNNTKFTREINVQTENSLITINF